MSRVVVAWKPRSANASAPACSSRSGVGPSLTGTPGAATLSLSKRLVMTGPYTPSQPWRKTSAPESIFEPEHEALRASAKEFLDRHVRPRMDEFIEAKALPRDVWIEAGKQGLLGLHVPEQYGGPGECGDYRFVAVVAEEQSKASGPRCPPASASTPTSSRRT